PTRPGPRGRPPGFGPSWWSRSPPGRPQAPPHRRGPSPTPRPRTGAPGGGGALVGREREAHHRRRPRHHRGVAPVEAQLDGLGPHPVGRQRGAQVGGEGGRVAAYVVLHTRQSLAAETWLQSRADAKPAAGTRQAVVVRSRWLGVRMARRFVGSP